MHPRHRRRDQACRDHPARRAPTAHLAIEDEVGRVAALQAGAHPRQELRKRAR